MSPPDRRTTTHRADLPLTREQYTILRTLEAAGINTILKSPLHPQQHSQAIRVLMHLIWLMALQARRSKRQRWYCTPKLQVIADQLGMSRISVIRYLRLLRELGLIKTTQRFHRRFRYKVSYLFVLGTFFHRFSTGFSTEKRGLWKTQRKKGKKSRR